MKKRTRYKAPPPAPPEPKVDYAFPPHIERMMVVWQETSSAIQNIECALPSQMTAAIERLIAARFAMEEAVRTAGMESMIATPRRRDDITAPPPRGPGEEAL